MGSTILLNLPLRCHKHPGLMLSDLGPIFSRKVINVITVIVAQTGGGLKLINTGINIYTIFAKKLKIKIAPKKYLTSDQLLRGAMHP